MCVCVCVTLVAPNINSSSPSAVGGAAGASARHRPRHRPRHRHRHRPRTHCLAKFLADPTGLSRVVRPRPRPRPRRRRAAGSVELIIPRHGAARPPSPRGGRPPSRSCVCRKGGGEGQCGCFCNYCLRARANYRLLLFLIAQVSGTFCLARRAGGGGGGPCFKIKRSSEAP
jgi:hypothetical protein